jgi:hypothetical protein
LAGLAVPVGVALAEVGHLQHQLLLCGRGKFVNVKQMRFAWILID